MSLVVFSANRAAVDALVAQTGAGLGQIAAGLFAKQYGERQHLDRDGELTPSGRQAIVGLSLWRTPDGGIALTLGGSPDTGATLVGSLTARQYQVALVAQFGSDSSEPEPIRSTPRITFAERWEEFRKSLRASGPSLLAALAFALVGLGLSQLFSPRSATWDPPGSISMLLFGALSGILGVVITRETGCEHYLPFGLTISIVALLLGIVGAGDPKDGGPIKGVVCVVIGGGLLGTPLAFAAIGLLWVGHWAWTKVPKRSERKPTEKPTRANRWTRTCLLRSPDSHRKDSPARS